MTTSTLAAPASRSPAPAAGALERALAALDQAAGPKCPSPMVVAKARGLLAAYHARWAGAGLEAFAVRATLGAPILNPLTRRASRTFQLAGQCDGVVGWRERRSLLEVRTAGPTLLFGSAWPWTTGRAFMPWPWQDRGVW